MQAPQVFLDPRLQLGFLVADVARRFRLAFDDAVRDRQITRSQWRALAYILREPGLTQSSLATQLELGRAAAGDAIVSLEKLGFITRQRDRSDRRVWRLHPTEKAQGAAPELADVATRIADVAFATVSDEEVAETARVLQRVIDGIANISPRPIT